eukprot:300846-Prorocentrum_minimum.AAC.3
MSLKDCIDREALVLRDLSRPAPLAIGVALGVEGWEGVHDVVGLGGGEQACPHPPDLPLSAVDERVQRRLGLVPVVLRRLPAEHL